MRSSLGDLDYNKPHIYAVYIHVKLSTAMSPRTPCSLWREHSDDGKTPQRSAYLMTTAGCKAMRTYQRSKRAPLPAVARLLYHCSRRHPDDPLPTPDEFADYADRMHKHAISEYARPLQRRYERISRSIMAWSSVDNYTEGINECLRLGYITKITITRRT